MSATQFGTLLPFRRQSILRQRNFSRTCICCGRYLQLPVAVCVLAAYFTANRISPSVYEVIAAVSMLPDLPRVDDSIDNRSVADAMISLDRDAVLFAHEGVTVVRS